MTLSPVLPTLRDVPGVHGSFVVTEEGSVVGRDLAPMFGDDILTEAGARLVRLAQTFTTDGAGLHSCVLRCGVYFVYVRVLPGGMLCVLASDGASMPALRMATNLAARRIGRLSSPPPEPPAAPAPPPPPASGGRSSNVQWRGAVMRDRR